MKTFGLKRAYLFTTSILVFIINVFAFAKSKTMDRIFNDGPGKPVSKAPPSDSPSVRAALPADAVIPTQFSIYDSMHLGNFGLSQAAYDNAIKGFRTLINEGRIAHTNILTIIDFSKPSSEKRLFIIDIRNLKLLYRTYVAHGVNSGREMASRFSNTPESNMSSLGFYETSTTYEGSNGYSLHLRGLERGINDNAYDRAIVMHGADYVNEDYIRSQGYIGRSWGCPAVSPKLCKPIIDRIKNGTCMFIYSPDRSYTKLSRLD